MSKTYGPMWKQISGKPLRWALYFAVHHESGPVGKDLPMIEIRYVPSQGCWKASSWPLGREEIMISESDGEAVGLAMSAARDTMYRWLQDAMRQVDEAHPPQGGSKKGSP